MFTRFDTVHERDRH